MEYLGIELGSTRIKAVIIDETGAVVAKGAFAWENRPAENGIWTYELKEALAGVASAYCACADEYAAKRGARPRCFAAMGVSAMMHGYVVFDADGHQLAPFRTWRSTNATAAATALSEAFDFNVPIRWSISQLYQSVLDREEHVKNIAFQTTLAGYIHYCLTGRKVLGIDDASGMFPIDARTRTYDSRMAEIFRGMSGLDITATFPKVLPAGEDAGALTVEGARLLDPAGVLEAGIPLCPPEGDAATGMVATDSVRAGGGNVSAGTSVFAMVVMEKPLSHPYREIDVVSTPSGDDVAMVHCNNGCGELDKWVALFGGDYTTLFNEAMEKGERDCGGIMATNWISSEPLAGVEEPGPRLVQAPGARLTRANIIRAQLNAVFATLKLGMDILRREGVRMSRLTGHGGVFTVPGVAQQILSDMLGTPIACMRTAGEGGAWGIAALAAYRESVLHGNNGTLADFLDAVFFANADVAVCVPFEDCRSVRS